MKHNQQHHTINPESLTPLEKDLIAQYHILDREDKELLLYFLERLLSQEEYAFHVRVKQQDGTYSMNAYRHKHCLPPYND